MHYFLAGIFFLFFGASANTFETNPDRLLLQCDDSQTIYTVKPGDKLYEIAQHFGSIQFWELIYVANADQINQPDLIFPGQQFNIPYSVATFHSSGMSPAEILSDPFCDLSGLPLASVDTLQIVLFDIENALKKATTNHSLAEPEPEDREKMQAFRDAFEDVVNKKNKGQNPEQIANPGDAQRESERRLMMEIDGMVHDETRSKVGRDFYDVFYTHWASPPDTYNFSIHIAEQPSPSLGTIIYVKVNDTETFRMRIQPRYDFIQQAGKYAVKLTYNHLQNNDHQVQIY